MNISTLLLTSIFTVCMCTSQTCHKGWVTKRFQYSSQASHYIFFELTEEQALSSKMFFQPFEDGKNYSVVYLLEECECEEKICQ